jgi:hypothetical protein
LLRQKLDAYFATEGAKEPIILTIPKGGYAPEFIERPARSVAESAKLAAAARSDWHIPLVRRLLAGMALLALAVVVLVWLLVRSIETRPQPPHAALSALWSQLFSDELTTTVVVPDHAFAMVQEASGEKVDLSGYLRRETPADNENLRQLEALLPSFRIRRYTTYDGVSTAVRALRLAEHFPSKVVVRYARDVTLRDLSPGHVILIGRPVSNLWGELFESKLNFRFHSDLSRHVVVCRNASPQPGEPAEYWPVEEGAKRTVYASVAFVQNLNQGGNVLIIAGASSGSQEGAAEFATNEKLLGAFVEKIKEKDGRLPYFDALIRTTTIDGHAQEPEVVAYRTLKP